MLSAGCNKIKAMIPAREGDWPSDVEDESNAGRDRSANGTQGGIIRDIRRKVGYVVSGVKI